MLPGAHCEGLVYGEVAECAGVFFCFDSAGEFASAVTVGVMPWGCHVQGSSQCRCLPVHRVGAALPGLLPRRGSHNHQQLPVSAKRSSIPCTGSPRWPPFEQSAFTGPCVLMTPSTQRLRAAIRESASAREHDCTGCTAIPARIGRMCLCLGSTHGRGQLPIGSEPARIWGTVHRSHPPWRHRRPVTACTCGVGALPAYSQAWAVAALCGAYLLRAVHCVR